MRVHVDLTAGMKAKVSLLEPADTKRFDVIVSGAGDDKEVANALAMNGMGPLEPAGEGHVFVDAGEVRRLALLEVPDIDGWGAEFDGMLAYAKSKGWLDDTGTYIKAHIERAPAESHVES